MKKSQLLKQLIEAARKVSIASFEVGRIVRQLRKLGVSYVDMKKAGLSVRMLRYAEQVAVYAEDAGLSDNSMVVVGVSKMIVIAGSVPPSEAGKWMLIAQKMTVAELKQAIAGSFEVRGATLFRFTSEQQQLVDNMMLRYGGNRRGKGIANKEAALERILRRLELLEDLTPIAQTG